MRDERDFIIHPPGSTEPHQNIPGQTGPRSDDDFVVMGEWDEAASLPPLQREQLQEYIEEVAGGSPIPTRELLNLPDKLSSWANRLHGL